MAKVEEEKKINRIEEERFRKLAQMNAALRAKLDFIQSKYDFTTNVNVLNSDDFKTLMTSNDMVSFYSVSSNCVGECDDEGLHGETGGEQDRHPEIRGPQV